MRLFGDVHSVPTEQLEMVVRDEIKEFYTLHTTN